MRVRNIAKAQNSSSAKIHNSNKLSLKSPPKSPYCNMAVLFKFQSSKVKFKIKAQVAMLLQIQSGSSLNVYKCRNKRLNCMYVVLLIIMKTNIVYICKM